MGRKDAAVPAMLHGTAVSLDIRFTGNPCP
jgi:hypothetical protein